jgi:hypothetical protein
MKRTMKQQHALLTKKELAAALGRNRKYVYRMQRAGFLLERTASMADAVAAARSWLAAHPGFRATGKKCGKSQEVPSHNRRKRMVGEAGPREIQLMRGTHDYCDFDYDAVDGTHAGENDNTGGAQTAALVHALGELCRWLAQVDDDGTPPALGSGRKVIDAKATGLRTLAALWVLRPELLGVFTLTRLSEELGVTDTILSRYACAFRDRFGLKGRGQRPNATRELMRRAKRPIRVEDN